MTRRTSAFHLLLAVPLLLEVMPGPLKGQQQILDTFTNIQNLGCGAPGQAPCWYKCAGYCTPPHNNAYNLFGCPQDITGGQLTQWSYNVPGDNYTPYVPTCSLQPPACTLTNNLTDTTKSQNVTFYATSDVHLNEGLVADEVNHVHQMKSFAGIHNWPASAGTDQTFVQVPKALIVNGDMSVGGRSEDIGAFRLMYDPNNVSAADQVSIPIMPGLGNHDIGQQAGCDLNNCAQRMWDYVYSTVQCAVNIDTGNSNNYSWDWGKLHLIQLNLWAGDVDFGTSNTAGAQTHGSGLAWLVKDLQKVGTTRPIILLQHFGFDEFSIWNGTQFNADGTPGEGWWKDRGPIATGYTQTQRDVSQFLALIAGYNIVGMYTGHRHYSGAYFTTQYNGQVIDDFVGGSGGLSEQGQFWVVNFANDFLTTGDAEWFGTDGAANWTDPGSPGFAGSAGLTACRKYTGQIIDYTNQVTIAPSSSDASVVTVTSNYGAPLTGNFALGVTPTEDVSFNTNSSTYANSTLGFFDRCGTAQMTVPVPGQQFTYNYSPGYPTAYLQADSFNNVLNSNGSFTFKVPFGYDPKSLRFVAAGSDNILASATTIYAPTTGSITVDLRAASGSTTQTFTWQAPSWLTVTASSSTLPARLTIQLNGSPAVGQADAIHIFADPNSTTTGTRILAFYSDAVVTSPGALVLTPTPVQVNLSLASGATNQGFTISAPGWLNVTSSSTTLPATLTVAFSSTVAAMPNAIDNIEIDSTGATFAPARIRVTSALPNLSLTITPANAYCVNAGTKVYVAASDGSVGVPFTVTNPTWKTITSSSTTLPATLTITQSNSCLGANSSGVNGRITITPQVNRGVSSGTFVVFDYEGEMLTVQSTPAGLSLSENSLTSASPFVIPYAPSSSVTVSAANQMMGGDYFTFNHWSDRGQQTHSVALNSDTTLTATFDINFPLAVNVNPPHSGQVTVSPASSYQNYYPAGTLAALVPAAAPGFVFGGMTGASTNGNGNYSVGINSAQTVTVNFARLEDFGSSTLATSPASNPGAPMIVDGKCCTAAPWTYNWGTAAHTVQMQDFVPDAGKKYYFLNWSDGYAPATRTITGLPNHSTYTANYELRYLLQPEITPANAVQVTFSPARADGYYPLNSSVTVTETVQPGWLCPEIGKTGQKVTNLVVVASVNFTATCTAIPTTTISTNPPSIPIAVDGTSAATPASYQWTQSPSHTIAAPLTFALPNQPGYFAVFQQWSDGVTSATRTVTGQSTANQAFQAIYGLAIQIQTTVSPAGAGTVSITPANANGLYQTGTALTLKATPTSGFTFHGFGAGVPTGNPVTISPTTPQTVTAQFDPGQPTLYAASGARTDGTAPNTRIVPISLTNIGAGGAADATIASITGFKTLTGSDTVTLAQTLPADLGSVPVGASKSANVLFNWPANASRVQFTVNFSANGGQYTGSTTLTLFR